MQKLTATLLFLFTSQLLLAQTNPCNLFLARSQEVDQLKTSIQIINRNLLTAPHATRNNLLLERKALYSKFQEKSRAAASLLENCAATAPTEAEKDLIRKYQIAKYYIDGLDCAKAAAFIMQCRHHENLHTAKLNNKPLSNSLALLSNYCQSPNNTKTHHWELRYGGKGLYYELGEIDSIDNIPYTLFEKEELDARALSKEEADASLSAFLKLSADSTIYYSFPFVLIAGPGNYQYNAIKPEKSLPISERIVPMLDNEAYKDNKTINKQRGNALHYISDSILMPYYHRLSSKYFDSLKFSTVFPVYLAGGSFNRNSYSRFLQFAQKVHFRSPGPRVAYYSPYDKSIMAWMPTGGGTLIHELVHALMDNEFPGAPAWLSEGMASMHEEMDNTTFEPKNNYRLYYIDEYTKRFQCSFGIEKLLAIEAESFNKDPGSMLYSAFARYFSMYLHEKGVLEKVYKAFRAHPDLTITAQKEILEKVTQQSIEVLQSGWEMYIRHQPLPQKWQSLQFSIQNYMYELYSSGLKCK